MPTPMTPSLNYAESYSRELANAYPYALYFGAIYGAENNGRYRMGEDGKTVYIPKLTTTGRVAADRDTIAFATRNYSNSWEPKTLTFERKWSTLVHPKDVDQTNQVTTIANITKTFNETQKFPEMDAHCASEIYKQWVAQGKTADHTALTTSSIISVFDNMMKNMDEARVPASGRILYCTNDVKTLLKNVTDWSRSVDIQSGNSSVSRAVNRIDEVEIVPVPASLMKTEYDFTNGYEAVDGADQINMMLVHPSAIIAPISYQNVALDPPSAVTEGKYIYFEESFEDIFILNARADAIQINTTVAQSDDNTLSSLKIGSLTLSPTFAKDTVAYSAATTDTSNKVTAVATDGDATIAIKLGGTSKGTGTGSAEANVTWSAGSNTLTVEVTTNSQTKTYTVTVTKS